MSVCVVVMLTEQMAETVRTVWSDIRSRWGIELSHPTSVPHFTLATLRGEPMPQLLRPGLTSTAAGCTPFSVSGAGYGMFIGHGEEPSVIHLALTRAPELSNLHDKVTQVVADRGYRMDGQTKATFWRPHITLVDTALTPTVVGEIMGYLAEHGPRHWTADVNNLSVFASDGSLSYRLPLGTLPTGARD